MKEKILVVDDEVVSTYFLKLYLTDEGFEVMDAARGDEAIEIGLSFKPQVLVTDWMLKDGKDGIDVAKTLYAQDPNLKIIFITGMASDVIEGKASQVPYLGILEKPLDLSEIAESIQKILRKTVPTQAQQAL